MVTTGKMVLVCLRGLSESRKRGVQPAGVCRQHLGWNDEFCQLSPKFSSKQNCSDASVLGRRLRSGSVHCKGSDAPVHGIPY